MNKNLFFIAIMSILFVFNLSFTSAVTWDNVAYYKLDSSSGTVAIDSSSNGYNGNCINCEGNEWVSGRINNGIEFNFTSDTNERINVTDNANLDIVKTVTFWFYNKDTSGAAATRVLIAKNVIDGIYGGLSYEDDSRTIVYYNSSGVNNVIARTSALGRNQWYHVTLTMNGTNRTIYIGGQQNASGIDSTSTPWNNAGDLNIGGFTTRTIKGIIDEVGLWSRVLSVSEIQEFPNNVTFTRTTLNSPADNYETINQTIFFNATSNLSGSTLVNATLYINGVSNGTISLSGSSQTYNFTRTLALGDYNWSVGIYDNNSIFEMSDNRSFSIVSILVNSVSYDTPIVELQSTSYVLNVSSVGTISQAKLVYNGTNYTSSIYVVSTGYLLSNSQLSPSVNSTSNINFYWWVSSSEGVWTSNNYTQTVQNIAVDNCSSYTTLLYNFTIKDEITQTILNATPLNTSVNIYLTISSSDDLTTLLEYNNTLNKINPFAICLSSNLSSGEELLIDTQVQYDASGYASEYYNIQSDTLDNESLNQNITLYDLDDTNSQEFKLTFKNEFFLPVENAIIQVHRKYIGEGIFKIVEIPLTDSLGQSLLHLQLDDVIYNIYVYKEGELLASLTNVLAKCNVGLETCAINLNSFTSNTNIQDFSQYGNLIFTLSLDKSTSTLSSTFSTQDASVSSVVLSAVLFNGLNNESICNDSLTASSGTLSCTIPSTYGNSTIYALITVDGEEAGFAIIPFYANPREIYGGNLIFIGLIMLITLVGIGFSGNPVILGVYLILGAILMVTLNIITSAGLIGTGATILWLIIAIIVILFKAGGRQ